MTVHSKNKIGSIIQDHNSVIDGIDTLELAAFCEAILSRLKLGGRLFFAGNGGSAADCQHLAAEFIGRFKRERNPLPAIALTTDSSILTAVANDYDFERVFQRQVYALCEEGDLLVVISTSGNSNNLIRAVEEARRKKTFTIGLLGTDGGKLSVVVDLSIIVRSNVAARVQEAHILIGHILCEICDEYFSLSN